MSNCEKCVLSALHANKARHVRDDFVTISLFAYVSTTLETMSTTCNTLEITKMRFSNSAFENSDISCQLTTYNSQKNYNKITTLEINPKCFETK